MGNAAEKLLPVEAHEAHERVDRDARAGALLACVPPVEDDGFSHVLDGLIDGAWRRSVLGRAPAAFVAEPSAAKIRAGFSTYCALGLSAIACSRRRPRALSLGSRAAAALGLGPAAVASVVRRGLPWLYRVGLARELDRVACASAFILVIDEIFDDELAGETGEARIAAVDDIVHGRRRRTTPAEVLAAALVDALASSSPARWPRMAERLVSWADAEVRLERGDPTVEPRRAGIEVSMELLAFAAAGYVGDAELCWMVDIATLGQMVDDVLDVEKDLAAGRVTPGATGAWDVATVGALYARLVDDTRALVTSSGERNPVVAALYERTFRAQLRNMAEVLVDNP